MAYRKPKYSIGIQNVEVRPGATGAEKATAMADFAGKGSAVGSQLGSAFGPWGTAIGGAFGAVGGAVGGFFKGQQDALIADSMRRTDELDRKETMQQNMSYGGQENKQLKNAVIMQNNAGLIAEKGMKKTPHALVEVEGQELVYRKNNKGKYQLVQDHGGGPTHEQGGIDTWVKEGDVITPAKDRGVFMNITNPATGEVIDDQQFEYFKNKLPEDNQEKPVKSMMECGTKSVKPRYFMGGMMGMMGGGGGNTMNPIGSLTSGGLGALADSKQQDANAMIQQNAMQNQALNQAQMNTQQPMSGINQPALPMQRKGNKMVKPQYGIGGLVETDPTTGQVIKQGAGSSTPGTVIQTSGSTEKPGETKTTYEKQPPKPAENSGLGYNKVVDPSTAADVLLDEMNKTGKYGYDRYTPDVLKIAAERSGGKYVVDPATGRLSIPQPDIPKTTVGSPQIEEWQKQFLIPPSGSDPSASQSKTTGGLAFGSTGGNTLTGGDNWTDIGGIHVNTAPSDAAVAEQEKTKRAAENNRAREAQPDIPPPQQFEYGKYQMPAGKLVAPNLNFDPASPTYQQYQDLSDPLRNQSNLAMNRDMANARELSGGSAANARANMAQASAGNFARQQQIDNQEMGRLGQVDAANRQSDNQFNMYNNQGANAVAQANAQNLANVQNQNMLNANQALNTNLNAMQTDRASARARDDYNKYTKEVQIERDRMAMERERQNQLIYGIPNNNPFSGHSTLGTKGPQDTDKGPVSKWFPNSGKGISSNTTPQPTPDSTPAVPNFLMGEGFNSNNNMVPSGSQEALAYDSPVNPNPPNYNVPLSSLGQVDSNLLNSMPIYPPQQRKGNKYVKPRYAEGGEVDKEEDETEETDAGTADIGTSPPPAPKQRSKMWEAKMAKDAQRAEIEKQRIAANTQTQDAYFNMVSNAYNRSLDSFDKEQLIDQTGGNKPVTNSPADAGASLGSPLVNSGKMSVPTNYSMSSSSGDPSASQSKSASGLGFSYSGGNVQNQGDNLTDIGGIHLSGGGGYGGYPSSPNTTPKEPTIDEKYDSHFGREHREARRLAKAEMNQTQYLTEQKQKQEREAARIATKTAKTQGKYAYKSYKDDAEAQRRLNQTQNNYGQYVEEREQAQEDATDMNTYNQMMKQKGIVNRGENREQRGYNRAQGQERRQGDAIDRILHKTEMDNARTQRELQGIKNDDAVARAYDNTVFANPDLPEAERFTVEEKYGIPPKERKGLRYVKSIYKK